MYVPKVLELPGENKIKFPNGKETILASFGKDFLKTGLVSEKDTNVFELSLETTGQSYNIDNKTKSPLIKISNYLGEVFINGNMSDNKSFEELTLLAYEFSFSGTSIITPYKKSFPLSRIPALEAYLKGLNTSTIVIFSLSGDDTKQSLSDFNKVYKDIFKSNMSYANKEYMVSQRWLGVWSNGSIIYESYKNYSVSHIPTKNDLFLNIGFSKLSKNDKGLLTDLTPLGFTVTEFSENVSPGVVCTISSKGLKAVWLDES